MRTDSASGGSVGNLDSKYAEVVLRDAIGGRNMVLIAQAVHA